MAFDLESDTVRLCYEDAALKTPWGPIKIEQRGVDSFRVTYGKQVDDHLTYAEACCKYGQAVMHWLSCEGKVDNRTRREAREQREDAK